MCRSSSRHGYPLVIVILSEAKDLCTRHTGRIREFSSQDRESKTPPFRTERAKGRAPSIFPRSARRRRYLTPPVIFFSRMSTLVECVPNFSEGRDAAKVDAIVEAMKLDGVHLLDREMDADHNRCVITLVGEARGDSGGGDSRGGEGGRAD